MEWYAGYLDDRMRARDLGLVDSGSQAARRIASMVRAANVRWCDTAKSRRADAVAGRPVRQVQMGWRAEREGVLDCSVDVECKARREKLLRNDGRPQKAKMLGGCSTGSRCIE